MSGAVIILFEKSRASLNLVAISAPNNLSDCGAMHNVLQENSLVAKNLSGIGRPRGQQCRLDKSILLRRK